jgi:phosphoribosylaminoimidazole-succinocarboxamide synthase
MAVGYTQEGKVRKFWPDNTPEELWIETSDRVVTLDQILNAIQDHFKTSDPTKFKLRAIQLETLGGAGWPAHLCDVTNFIKVTKHG